MENNSLFRIKYILFMNFKPKIFTKSDIRGNFFPFLSPSGQVALLAPAPNTTTCGRFIDT